MSKAEEELIRKAMSALGSRTSPAKAKAAKANGKLGGWPKGKKRKRRHSERA